MKTSEFVSKVSELGFKAKVYDNSISVVDKSTYSNPVAIISRDVYCRVNTSFNAQERLSKDISKELYSIIFEYALTPLEEREEPKKYYLRLPNAAEDGFDYLNYNFTSDKKYFFDSSAESCVDKNKFTQEEIDELPCQDFIKTLIKEEVKCLEN